MASSTARAQDSSSNFASGPGTYLFLAAGVGLPLLRDGSEGKNHFFRTADSGLSAVLLAEGLKRLTRVPRPDTGERDSFPSEHATAAFAVATMESDFHPREAPLWYAGATVISLSRLWEGRHRPLDVLGGAALGFATARLELSRNRGLLLTPWIDGRSAGMMLTAQF
ncbi:Membrane-associated phospholipid phosphatase [Fimbriimonas ginsengisoli Gsoil 348]|uniref:Membrane-associated phospholipid phosphatase n=1 Tax=Fimbriimonas ginsengisoli Gsoil 348 TaxID=661478 RepID=A0A068NQ62_FIMGI|nr:Membrane-associated phospholipid phosphatase [Fimbriimonas ginsengisoli Gsoil 348]